MSTSFDSFEDRPYWRPHYAVGVSTLLKEIPLCYQAVKQFVKNPENDDYVNGFVPEYRSHYITECNRGEKTGTQTHTETEYALSNDPRYTDERNKLKTQNLARAIFHVFENSFFVERLKLGFNADLAKKLNELIGAGLFADAGCYRKTSAKPRGYNFFYLEPCEIEQEMTELFEEVNRLMKSDNRWFVIAAKFFERFLLIHPFSNGNGRTARILLSALLTKCTIVPVCLFNVSIDDKVSSQVYLNCVTEAHEYGNFKLLSSLIIESAHRSLQLFLSSLDIHSY